VANRGEKNQNNEVTGGGRTSNEGCFVGKTKQRGRDTYPTKKKREECDNLEKRDGRGDLRKRARRREGNHDMTRKKNGKKNPTCTREGDRPQYRTQLHVNNVKGGATRTKAKEVVKVQTGVVPPVTPKEHLNKDNWHSRGEKGEEPLGQKN